ncbi:MAG TPA: hypothetical protein VME68_16215 [Acidobacteriaceae bacterium]|nr:hypothetical protein [Acidobacteriaceae bacterium]
MRTLTSRISLPCTLLALGAALALALFAAPSLAAQKTGLAFWEPPASVDALLSHAPRRDSGRYTMLRQAFVDAHCADPDQDGSELAGKDKNLSCTLPGATPQTILVVARYDGRAGPGFQSTWVDALTLPLLDRAIQAQPRHHTFQFVAMNGDEGEYAFLQKLRKSEKPAPSAMIILDGLGWGSPLWYTVPSVKATPGHPAELGVNGLLGAIASGIGRFMKIPDPTALNPEHFRSNVGFSSAEYYRSQRYESTLFRGAGSIPELLLYSDRPEAATIDSVDLDVKDIRKDLDYAAYVLCLADLKLDAPAAPASEPAADAPNANSAPTAAGSTPQ